MTSENSEKIHFEHDLVQGKFEFFIKIGQSDMHSDKPCEVSQTEPQKPIKEKVSSTKHKPTKEELKTIKKHFPQIWELEGKNGIHTTMQKRAPNRLGVVNPREKYPQQERKDQQKLSPKKDGWGPYNNLTRKEWSEKFFEICVNNIFQIAEWVDSHPHHPKAEYFRKTVFRK